MKWSVPLVSVAVATTLSVPAASAAGVHGTWDSSTKNQIRTLEVQTNDYLHQGGWCNKGRSASAVAIRTLDGRTKTVYVLMVNNNEAPRQFTVKVTPTGVVVPVALTGHAGMADGFNYTSVSDLPFDPDDSMSADTTHDVMNVATVNPSSCAGLASTPPSLPSGWSPSKKTPVKKAPAKKATSKKAPTKKAPVKKSRR